MLPILYDCGPGNSMFQFIDKHWKAPKDSSNNRAFHRLCSFMRKMGANRILIEDLTNYNIKEIDEDIHALSKIYDKVECKPFRFTFLSDPIKNINDIENIDPISILGNSILMNILTKVGSEENRKSYILQSITQIPSMSISGKKKRVRLLNNYFHAINEFDGEVIIRENKKYKYRINGTFFCQQNGITSVCAHSSVKMLINNLSSQREMISTERINTFLGFDHVRKKVGDALETEQLIEFITDLGYKTDYYDFFEDPKIHYAQYIHRLLEGGCPSMLIFTTDKLCHVVTIFGHTLNSDIWVPEAELAYTSKLPKTEDQKTTEMKYYGPGSIEEKSFNYRPATVWVDHFIIHDDNFGMYLCLPIESLRREVPHEKDKTFRALGSISIVPCEFDTSGREAEWFSAVAMRQMGLKLEGSPSYWIEKLFELEKAPLVIRTALLTRKIYYNHLKSETAFDGTKFTKNEISWLLKELPNFFWLCEITLPDLFATNKTKLVDLVYDCEQEGTTDPIKMWEKVHLIRFPSLAIKRRRDGAKKQKKLGVDSHYPMFKLYHEEASIEW